MTLKEVSITDAATTYAAEFFTEVAKQPEGKVFAFERKLPETTIRSQAQVFGKTLGVKFTVVTVKKADAEGNGGSFAVGVTTKERKPREKKATIATPIVPEDSPAIPAPEGVSEASVVAGDVETEHDGPSASDVEEAILAAEGAV